MNSAANSAAVKPPDAPRTVDAQIGTLGAGGDGVLSLCIGGSGTLGFDWTLRGAQETGGALAFALKLPPSPSIQLQVQLPPGLIPSVEQGFVTKLASSAAASAAATASTTPGQSKAPDGQTVQTWQIDLGGQNQVVLHLSPRDLLGEHRPLTLVRQSLVYDVSPQGLQLSAELKLDVLGEPVRQLTLLVDRPLELVTARCGDAQIPWAELDALEPAGAASRPGLTPRPANVATAASTAQSTAAQARRVVLDFSEPLVGRGRVIRLGAVAPLPKQGRIPTVRPAAEGAFWREGTASLLVSRPLELNALRLQGARQTKVEPLAAPLAGEAITVQFFRPDADLQVAIAPQPERLQYRSGTTIDVRGSTMSGRYVADIAAIQGECFELEADIAPSWIIDSVDSIPAGAVADWNRAGSDNAVGRLRINLSKSIRPERSLRLVVRGRWRRAPLGERLHPDDLEMVGLRRIKAERRLAVIRLATAFRSQFIGADGLHRLDLKHLDPADAALVGDEPGGSALVLDDAAVGLAVALDSETPRFSGEVQQVVKVTDRMLTESYVFHCTPESAELDRLLIHFSRARAEPLHWRLAPSGAKEILSSTKLAAGAAQTGSTDKSADKLSSGDKLPGGSQAEAPPGSVQPGEAFDSLSIRRLSAAEQASAGLAAVGEVWELKLRQPQGTPLTFTAERTTPLVDETPVSLGWLVQAVAQLGTVTVASSGELFPKIINRRLKPIPADPPPPDGWPSVLAAYQYEPQDEIVSAASDPAPSLSIAPGDEPPAAWAWSCRLDSHYSADRAAEHLVSLRIENTGRSRLHFQLPSGGRLDAAWIDGSPAVVANSAAKEETAAGQQAAGYSSLQGSSLQLDLPSGRRFVAVAVHWTSAAQPLSLITACSAELPEFDLPILARQWYVWLPPRYRLANPTTEDGAAIGQISWSQRLFGPFGRPTGEPAFDPAKSSSWLDLTRPVSGDDPAWNYAKQFLHRLASRARPHVATANESKEKSTVGRSSSTTWGALLSETQAELAHQAGDGLTVPLLIDATALASVGLSPPSLVRIPAVGGANSDGWPLSQADLVLLVHPRAILLTTRSASSALSEPWSTPGNVLLRQVAAGSVAEELKEAGKSGGSERFPSVEAWSLRDGKSPWLAAGEHRATDEAGGIVYHFELPDAALPRIWIGRADALLGLGCSLFLLVTMVVWWLGAMAWRWKGIVMAGATVIALLVPSILAPLGAGLWLGLACGWILRGLTGGNRAARGAARDSALSARASVVGGALVCLLVVAGRANAAEPAALPLASATDVSAVPEVLIPIDEQQHPKGKVYLVPESLYNELVRRVAQANPPTADWLISAATYHGGLTLSSKSGAIGTTDWSASYDLNVFAADAHVRMPFGGLGTNLLPDGVRLDGRPIRFRWTDSRQLEFTAAEAGHHALQLAFRPTPTASTAETTIDFSVLGVATARIELSVPAGLDVRIPSAQAALTLDRQTGRLSGLLGPAERVTVRSSPESGRANTPAVADVDELFWLRIRPGSVVLDTRFNFRVIDGRLSEIRLRADPRLRRLPSADNSLGQVRIEQGDPQTIHVGLNEPATERVSLKMSFLLADASGIGDIRLPPLDALDVRSLTKRLAVSVESPLEYDEPAAGLFPSAPVDQFLSAWGGADVPPQLVYQLAASSERWHLAIHPRQPQLTSNDQIVATFAHGRLSVAWLADLSIRGGSIFQLHLPLGPQFEVESVQLRQTGAEDRPIRWARSEGGVTLFLPGPVADRAKVLLRGGMPLASGTAPLPGLQIDAGQADSQTILVLRGADEKVTLASPNGLKVVATADLQIAIDRAMKDGLLGSRAVESNRAALCLSGKPAGDQLPTFVAEPNAPRVKAIEKISVERADDAWTARVDLDLNISGGDVDALRFEVPPQWNRPTQVVPEMPLDIVDIPGESRRQMILRPKAPIRGGWRLSFSGPIAGGGQRVRVPDVRPLGLGAVRRFVLLPTHSNEQQLVWETRGLNVEPLPAGFAANSPQLELYRACQVVGETFEATLKSVEKSTGQPHVRLADIAMAFPTVTSGYGTAAFDLEPAGSANCVLEFSEHTRPVYVRVNGLPAAVHPVAKSPLNWNVALASGKLPQHIEVVFQCDAPPVVPGATERRLAAPVLLRTPVEATLWTVAGPPGAEAAEATNAAAISKLKRDLDRLQADWQLLNSAAAVLTEESPATVSAWYIPWVRRLLADRESVQRQRGSEPALESTALVDDETRSIDEQQARLAQRIGTANRLDELLAVQPAPEGMMQLWQASNLTNHSAAGYYVHGFSPALGLAIPHAEPSAWSVRFAVALAGASIVGLLFWLGSRRSVRGLVTRWPYWSGVVIGLLWWLMLTPSLVGWAIVAACLVGAFWPGFGTGRQPT
jgi:hypothetical protein